ncbi:MAG: beta-ketoacyl synthase N-terminal-like domain-containing protein, partial [Planctomyces sp.]
MSAVPDSAIVLIGMACRVPGADSIEQFAELLNGAQTGYGELPPDRCDRALYYDPAKGVTGRTYTTLGGIVPDRSVNQPSPETESINDSARFDVTHRHFAETVATAWGNAGLSRGDHRVGRTGIFVGHSGGTKLGGALSLGTQIEEALTGLHEIPAFRALPDPVQRKLIQEVAAEIRKRRPTRSAKLLPCFQAYQAASLAAGFLRLSGPRSVIDAACASSLVALSQAILSIRSGRIETAVVGGATYNNVDNLILFSHSQACTSEISRPFDDRANGLVSSEGYVAVVVTTAGSAREHGFRVETVIRGLGISSDGRGKSLWAPRSEGQTLALRRAYEGGQLLDVDYLECHATSTQLGDATELESLKKLCSSSMRRQSPAPLLLGSVKSNIGHTLEAAGLIGMVKVLLAMKQGTIPPSLNFEIPNRRFDWKNAPFRIVKETTRWPSSLNRRAAVSAFGIGGLNAHVIVEQLSDRNAESSSTMAHDRNSADTRDSTDYRVTDEPIAIVGRGIVVAGAINLTKFGEAIRSGHSMLGPAPEDRWRHDSGIVRGGEPASGRTSTSVGGYIRDFHFDGQKYRIPPRQVQQSNPAQMMLIDAVAQSLEDCRPAATGPSDWPFSRERTSVVVGTVFGGEFGDNLQIGMRLPEISDLLADNLVREGISVSDAKKLCEEFGREFLEKRPALLDETGSFTASTLASRIAKTFDLMGGACALDADCSSGLTALQICVDQLRSGDRDLMVCGATQRSMNLAAFEQLDLSGRLVRSGLSEEVPDNCSRILPGEGVAVLLLCRLSDAVSRGLPIHGLVGDLQYRQSDSKATLLTAEDAKIVRQFGYLFGAHSLVRMIAQTVAWSHQVCDRICTTVRSIALDGMVVESRIMPPDYGTSDDLTRDDSYIVETQGLRCESPDLIRYPGSVTIEEDVNEPVKLMNRGNETWNSGESSIQRLRFSAASPAEMMQRLVRIQEKPEEFFRGSVSHFRVSDSYRVFMLVESVQQLKQRLAGVIKAWGRDRYSVVLEREKAVFWKRPQQAVRIACLFPGQGSHYVGVPSVVSSNSHSVTDVSELDQVLTKQGLEPVSALLNSGSGSIGDHIWFAQLWVLGVSRILFQALTRSGIRPDIVLGHSFGEFSAACAAGSLSLQELVRVSRMRADALALHVREAGGLLSVRGGLAEVDAVIRSAGLSVYVTHHNSLRQTVV